MTTGNNPKITNEIDPAEIEDRINNLFEYIDKHNEEVKELIDNEVKERLENEMVEDENSF